MEQVKRLGIFSVSVLLLFCSVQAALAQSELAAKVDELADKLTSSISGEVASVEGDIIYINLGEKDCVYDGSQFEVVRLGEVVMVGNKPIHKERPIGEIQITKVRKDMSLAKTTTSFAQIEKGDKVYQKRKKVTRIALTEFPYGENLNNLTKNVYESLSVSFSQKGMQVIERSQLEKVLQEQKVSYSGMIDISTAQKLGQLLGTEAIVLGTATDSGNNIAIRARLVDVGKGVVITAAQVEIIKNPEIIGMLEGGGREPGTKGGLGTSEPGPGKAKQLMAENEWVKIEVLGFGSEPGGLVLKLKYVNVCDKVFRINLDHKTPPYLIDDKGNQMPVKEGELLERHHQIELAPGIPRLSSLVFRDLKTGGREFMSSIKYEVHPQGTIGQWHWFFVKFEGLKVK